MSEPSTNPEKKIKKPHRFPVSRYSLSGKLLETYPNARVAAEAMNGCHMHLSLAARNTPKMLTAYGYIWRRSSEPEIDINVLIKKKSLPASTPLSKFQPKIGQYDLEGNLVGTFLNTKQAARAVGVHYQGIRQVTRGELYTYGGFIWSRTIKQKIKVDPKVTYLKSVISQYDLDGRWIRSFKTGLEAMKVTGVGNEHISQVVRGQLLTAGGFLWRKGQQLRINVNELRKHPLFETSKLQHHLNRKRKNAKQKPKEKADHTEQPVSNPDQLVSG